MNFFPRKTTLIDFPYRRWLKSMKITLDDEASRFGVSRFRLMRVSHRKSNDAALLALVHARTDIPIEDLLPLDRKSYSNWIREHRRNRVPQLEYYNPYKVKISGFTYPRKSVFILLESDSEIAVLRCKRGLSHAVPLKTLENKFKKL